jgi:glycine/D-amino acid oxidase-like deaminating enzyme
MMRTHAVGRLGPMLAAGLTLRHYESFRACPSLPELDARLQSELPLHARFGIHVLVSQTEAGELTIGDSHEYGAAIQPFDRALIDTLILEYLNGFFDATSLTVASRWHGVYAKHRTEPYVAARVEPWVTALVGFGGAGMTLSFGAAEAVVEDYLQSVAAPPHAASASPTR